MTTVVAIIFGGLLGLLILANPATGLVAIIASLPVQATYPQVPLGTSVLTLAGYVTLLSYMLHRLPARLEPGNRAPFLYGLALVLWMAVAHPGAVLAAEASRVWLLTFAQLIMLQFLGARLLTPHYLRVLMSCYVLSACVSAVAALWGFSAAGSFDVYVAESGLAVQRNAMAGFLVSALVMCIYLGHHYAHVTWWRRLFPIALILLALGVGASMSRSGLAELVVSLLLVAFFAHRTGARRLTARIVVPLLLALAVLVSLGYWGAVSARVADVLGEEGELRDARPAYWRAAIDIWRDNPVAGVGPGLYPSAKMAYIDPRYAHKIRAVAHNSFLSILAETGAVGLALFLLMLGSTLRVLWRMARAPGQPGLALLAAAWFIILVQLCVHGLTHNTHYHKVLWIIPGISMALTAAAGAGRQVTTREGVASARRVRE